MTNRAELRRLAEAAPENLDDDWMGLKRTEMRAALTPSVVLSLLDELDAKDNTLLALTTRHFAESWSRRSTDAKLDEYLSAGIAQLQEERDAAMAELEAIKSSGWRNHSVNYARAEKCPQTLETAQAAWDRDQELIEEQRQQIAKDSQTINDLRQKLEACRKDAKRYRFLCDPQGSDEDYLADAMNKLNAWADKSEVDQAVDAAMSQEAPNA